MQSIDHAICYAINQWPESLSPFFLFLSEGNKWTGVRIGFLALFSYYVWNPKTRVPALLILVAFPLTNEMTDILKAWLQVPRPCVELRETVNLRVNMMTSFGTASAHSGNMMAIATLFVFGAGWRYGLVWVIVAILTGISRIYVGVHYPSQVVFGWSCGVVVATITWFSCQAILRRRNQDQVEPSHEERPEAG